MRPGHEWDRFEGLALPADELERFLEDVPFNRAGHAPLRRSAPLAVPARSRAPKQAAMSTQQGFGLILNELARSGEPLADRIVTTSPDVTVSTNLGPWVNRRGLFAREEMEDLFKSERIPSTYTWDFAPKGQHIELGIAEMNLFLLLSALGLSHSLFGERLLPIGTLYDPFIARGLDALNYACYQDARFILVATPSGVTLAPEGGAHQSIGTPLIGMAQDGLAAFEPAFVDELVGDPALGLRLCAAGARRAAGDADADAKSPGCATRPAARSICASRPARSSSSQREMTPALAQDIVDGAYWLRKPGPNAQVVVAYTGARRAGGDRGGRPDGRGPPRRRPPRRHLGRPAQRRLDGGAAGARARPRPRPQPYRAAARGRAVALRPRHRARRPSRRRSPGSARSWATARARSASSISARPARSQDLYRHYGIDAQGIVAAAEMIAPGRPIRHLKALG